MILKKTSVLFIFLIFQVTISQNNLWSNYKLDINRIETKRDSFQMKQNGKVVGYWIWETKKEVNNLKIKDISVLTGMVEEEFDLTFNINKKVTTSVKMNMKYNSNTLDVNLNRNSARDLKAEYSQKGEKLFNIKVDTTYTKDVLLRPALLGVLPFIQNIKKVDCKIETFFLSFGKSATMHLKYLGEEKIKVPAGEYNTYKLDFKGENQLSNNIYITDSKPYRIVKVEIIGQPLIIELVK